MATLTSRLILSLTDRVRGPARGIRGALRGLRHEAGLFSATQRATATPLFGGIRSMVALGGAYLGVTQGISGTVGAAMDFQEAMADLAKKSTLTEAQLKMTEKRITSLSNTMPLAKTEIAGLIAQAAQFGIATQDLERFALLGAKSAIAFDMQASTTAEALSKLKNAFGLTMDELSGVADAINFTADSAGTSEQNVIDFLLRTAAAAKTYGISAQAMSAFGATLNEIGIESAKAGTGMNAMLAKLAGLTKNKKAKKALDQYAGVGYSAKLQDKFYNRPIDALQEFFGVIKKMPTKTRSGFLIDFFGLEYQDDASAIANNIDKINQRLNQLLDTSSYAGSVDKTFEIFANTTRNKLKVLQNNVSNIASMFGAKLLPPIAEFSDKLVGTLSTLDRRVTVFDKIKTAAQGFLTGLGLEGGSLGEQFNRLWDGVFGRIDTFSADVDTMAAGFERFRKMGADLRSFGSAIADTIGSIESFLHLEPGTIGDTLGTLAGYGFQLALASVGFSLAAGAITKLAKAVLFLSGASTVFGLGKGLLRILRAARGGAAAGAAGGAAVRAGAAGAAGTAATVGSRAGLFGRMLPPVAVGATAFSLGSEIYRRYGTEAGRQAAASFREAMNRNWQDNADSGSADYMKGFNVLGDAERRLGSNGPAGTGFEGSPEMGGRRPGQNVVPIDADDTAFQEKVGSVEERASMLEARRTVPVDADISAALAKLQALETRIAALGGQMNAAVERVSRRVERNMQRALDDDLAGLQVDREYSVG
ncbi:phage tail tape measure protein [Afifella sp. H1R]|uniref:phage tail tape measure protein n=1 Tax=Afifella sp. H1R TaxID=2908841 RepID=UPI001F46626E|nr:phage tail tape measure protein [Afifella sp. H1R]MCF1502895.1 phage tail tape measure protein [Afifella sp. H1R]